MTKRVESLTHLKRLAQEKRSVTCPKHPEWDGHFPAAFVINLSGHILEQLFVLGLYVYVPNKKTAQDKFRFPYHGENWRTG